ncbi:MAG: hypothetical protein ACM33T_08765 [Solirubrobacterales bacterium]
MLRTATAKVFHPEHAPVVRESATRTFTLHRDGQPFMVINGTFEHAQFIVAGFSRDHTWMLLAD